MSEDMLGRQQSRSEDLMLSSAEDLNIDGSFMGAGVTSPADDEIANAVEEVLNSSEPEDAPIDSDYEEAGRNGGARADFRPIRPVGHAQRGAGGWTALEARPQAQQAGDRPLGGSQAEDFGPTGHRPEPMNAGTQGDSEQVARLGAVEVVMPEHDPDLDGPMSRRDMRIARERRERLERQVRAKKKEAGRAEQLEDGAGEDSRAEAYKKRAACYRPGINKGALVWMIILTIVLGAVVGVMIYAFILDQMDDGGQQTSTPQPDASLQENITAVSGALEVYLTEINLDNYNTDIVLVNGGGSVSLKGTLKHTVYVNATSAELLNLNGVTIESEDNAAVVNLGKSEMTIDLNGMNTLISRGGKYKAALYSVGPLTLKGAGQVMIYAGQSGAQGIASENGYRVDGGAVIALAQKVTEQPKDESTQAYFSKELPDTYGAGVLVTASDEKNEQVVRFTAPGSFSSIFVSNSRLEDGVEYRIKLGVATEQE